MADQPGSSHPTPSKAVPSLAKKQSDVTRLGAHKLKFVPTLPTRRKKEEVKEEPAASSSTSKPSERGTGRGRGHDGRGRGRGRGGDAHGAGQGRGGARPPPVEMTASGPFAMGPTLAGTSARRTAPRINYTPVMPQGSGAGARLGAGLTPTTTPGVKREGEGKGKEDEGGAGVKEDEDEVYSEPDEGVEILDMEKVRSMDWMAPETLAKERKAAKKVKKEKQEDVKGKGVARETAMEVDTPEADEGKVNLANAVHLSDSEEEEEMEDIIEDFSTSNFDDVGLGQEPLYFFQFPHPLPTFLSKAAAEAKAKQEAAAEPGADAAGAKPVAASLKATPSLSGAATPSLPKKEDGAAASSAPEKVDGVVGNLEIYRSGAVKLRLGKDIVLDVSAGTQPSFLQHVVYVDPTTKQLCVFGNVHRRFVVSPDLDALLHSLEVAEHGGDEIALDEDGLIRMDTS